LPYLQEFLILRKKKKEKRKAKREKGKGKRRTVLKELLGFQWNIVTISSFWNRKLCALGNTDIVGNRLHWNTDPVLRMIINMSLKPFCTCAVQKDFAVPQNVDIMSPKSQQIYLNMQVNYHSPTPSRSVVIWAT